MAGRTVATTSLTGGFSPDYTGTADSVKIATHGCRGSMNHGVLYINPTSSWDARPTGEAGTW